MKGGNYPKLQVLLAPLHGMMRIEVLILGSLDFISFTRTILENSQIHIS